MGEEILKTLIKFCLKVAKSTIYHEQVSKRSRRACHLSGVYVTHCLCLKEIRVLVFSAISNVNSTANPVFSMYPSIAAEIKNPKNLSLRCCDKGFLKSIAIKILCQRAIIISYIKFMHPYLIVCGSHNFMGFTLWEELYIYPSLRYFLSNGASTTPI